VLRKGAVSWASFGLFFPVMEDLHLQWNIKPASAISVGKVCSLLCFCNHLHLVTLDSANQSRSKDMLYGYLGSQKSMMLMFKRPNSTQQLLYGIYTVNPSSSIPLF
jgi:hypothetical protein